MLSAENLKIAGSYILRAVAKIYSWFAGLPFGTGISIAAGIAASMVASYMALKNKLLKFAEGGIWTYGPAARVPLTAGAPVGIVGERGPERITPADEVAQEQTVINIYSNVVDAEAVNNFSDRLERIQNDKRFYLRG